MIRSGIAPEDLRACQTMLCTGSRSFFIAGLLLPRRVLEPATALYAFCRVADDLIDGGGDTRAALDVLGRRLDAMYAGRPWAEPSDRALAAVVEAHRLPRALLDGLLEGFAWDAEGRRYETLAELEAYAARVAGTVGAAMAALMGVREAALVARACDLGVAMQLSNIARDVGEDARAGRIYLPLAWLREVGIEPEAFLAMPRWSPALGEVIRRLVDAAEFLYRRADAGVAALPLGCRPGIGAARRFYSAIGHRAAALDPVAQRARVPGPAKLWLAARALAAAPWPGAGIDAPPLAAVRHLVSAVAASGPVRAEPGRLVWLIELFASLETRRSMERA